MGRISNLSEYNPTDDLERMKRKYESIDKVIKMMDKLRDYCIKNNCSIDDLIEAHKKLKNKK